MIISLSQYFVFIFSFYNSVLQLVEFIRWRNDFREINARKQSWILFL